MSASPRRFWSRYCVMDDFDDAMLSFALKDEFPNVRFFRKVRLLQSAELVSADTIPECDQTMVHIWFPRDGWEPLFFPHSDYPSRYNVINPPSLYLHYNRTRWFDGVPQGERKWAFSLPMPETGRISSGRWEWDEEERTFRSKVTKILGKLSNNRLKDWFQRDEVVSAKDAKRRNTWAGYNVLRWCAGERRRAIDSMYRPPDDWQFRETSWYSELTQRVVDRFGEDYGGPRMFKREGDDLEEPG